MPASRFIKIVQETGQIAVCSFYLPVSTSRNHPALYKHRQIKCLVQTHTYEMIATAHSWLKKATGLACISTLPVDPSGIFLRKHMWAYTQAARLSEVSA